MQVILREKVSNLGGLGKIVHVKSGYARNYLIPTGLALQATKANLVRFEEERAVLEKLAAEKQNAAESKAKKLEGMEIVISAHAGEGGKLFGSIGTRDIAEAVTAKGIAIDKHEVRMSQGVIRDLGQYDIQVHLHTEVEAKIIVHVKSDQVSDSSNL